MTGEFERIDRFLASFQAARGRVSGQGVLLGPGDDAALLSVDRPISVTTDAVVERVHFRRDGVDAARIGHKALAVNLSDLAAMGARPFAFTCALSLPDDVDDGWLDDFASGMARLASRHGAALVGGNFTRARELSVTITAMGVQEGEALRRDLARSGDAVMLVGEVGVAAGELSWLLAGRSLPPGRSALHEPEPLCLAGVRAAMRVRCGIDVSDGLVQDVGHVAKASGVRIVLEAARVPRTPGFDQLAVGWAKTDAERWLFAGGEDYALVLCGPGDVASELGATIIGRVEPGAGVEVEGLTPGTPLTGHDHFAGR